MQGGGILCAASKGLQRFPIITVYQEVPCSVHLQS